MATFTNKSVITFICNFLKCLYIIFSGQPSSVNCSSRTGGRRHHGSRTNNHQLSPSAEPIEVAAVETGVETTTNSGNRTERMGGTVASK